MKKNISGIQLEVVQGDITAQHDIMAVVNAANAQLKPGGGVAGAIHRKAGPQLEEYCRSLAPIKPGQAIITYGYDLPNQYVVHCLGPVYGTDEPADELLAACFTNALQVADDHDVDSIAFPAISTGAFGYPLDEAAVVSTQAVLEKIPDLKKIKTIRFVLFDEKTCQAFAHTLS